MITQIEIENFKCFRKESLVLKPLTLITGTNSSGKSSLIQALLWLAESSDMGLVNYLRSLGDFDDLKNKYVNPGAFDLRALMAAGDEVILSANKDEVRLEKPENYAFRHPAKATYLNAARHLFGEIQPVVPAKKHERNFGIAGEYTAGYFDAFKDVPVADDLQVPEAAAYTLEGQLDYWLHQITGIAYQLQTETVSSSSVKVFYRDGEGFTYKPGNVGTGISYLAAILIACLSAEPGNLIIIENPEIHLHPLSQSNLAAFFAFVASKGVQLIIETHNDHLINRIRYGVFKKQIASDDVIVYYKNLHEPFARIDISSAGLFVDAQGENRFPKGFYDATLQGIFEINQGR